jgi:hypothetical protein
LIAVLDSERVLTELVIAPLSPYGPNSDCTVGIVCELLLFHLNWWLMPNRQFCCRLGSYYLFLRSVCRKKRERGEVLKKETQESGKRGVLHRN